MDVSDGPNRALERLQNFRAENKDPALLDILPLEAFAFPKMCDSTDSSPCFSPKGCVFTSIAHRF